MLRCLISRGKIILKPHKWWYFWEKKQPRRKPTFESEDFDMNLPIVCVLHPHSWYLLSLKSFQFPKIIWNTPTPGVFDKQSIFYRENRVCVCVCVCVTKKQRKISCGAEEEKAGAQLAYTPGPTKTWTYKGILSTGLLPSFSLLRLKETFG
jgi:hypothetical protein